jgi:hypothetical protein
MTAEESGNMDRIIGGLQAQIAGFEKNWAEQDRRASEGRGVLHVKIEDLGKEVVGVAHKLESVIEDVKEMKPAVEDWKASKARAEGVVWSAKLVWIGVGVLGAGIPWVFTHFLAIVPH